MPEGLAGELKKRGPFESREEEMVLNLLRTNDRLQDAYGRFFQDHGLTSSQYNILRILRGEGRMLPMVDVAGRMVVQAAAVTRIVDGLEKLGFVCRRRCESDRRVIFVEATAKGLAKLKTLDGPLLEIHKRLVGHLSAAEVSTLNQLLEKARQGAGE